MMDYSPVVYNSFLVDSLRLNSYVDLTSESLCQIDMSLTESNARGLVQTISEEMDSNAVIANNSKFIALQVVMYLAHNAQENKEYNALCMFALSVAWGAKGYTEERTLPAAEAKFVEELTGDALRLVAENKQFVDSQVAKNFIGASILALCFKNPLSNV